MGDRTGQRKKISDLGGNRTHDYYLLYIEFSVCHESTGKGKKTEFSVWVPHGRRSLPLSHHDARDIFITGIFLVSWQSWKIYYLLSSSWTIFKNFTHQQLGTSWLLKLLLRELTRSQPLDLALVWLDTIPAISGSYHKDSCALSKTFFSPVSLDQDIQVPLG